MTALQISRDESVVPSLEELCRELHRHHAEVSPTFADAPARSAADVWEIKRRHYREWLRDPALGAFAVTAVDGGRTVGYALVRMDSPYVGWQSAERVALLESLCVLPETRGRGLGRALLRAVGEELTRAGVEQMRIRVVAANDSALRFYAAAGLRTVVTEMFGSVADVL